MVKKLNKEWENYKKPTPVKWRKRGDYALVLLIALQPFLMTAPFSDKVKWYIDVIFTFLLVTFKFWTNTKKQNETNINQIRFNPNNNTNNLN
jgi:hypothetical protein